MRVMLTSAYNNPEPLNTAIRLAEQDTYKEHEFVHDPEDADLVLFIESSHYEDDYFFRRLLEHPYLEKYRTKCLMYNEQARPFYVIPGLYVSLSKQGYDPVRQRASTYIRGVNEFVSGSQDDCQPDILYSFMGACRTQTRKKLLELTHPRGIIRDTTGFSVFLPKEAMTEANYQGKQEYVALLSKSKFILCPRGFGTSSFRLYETMQVGRVPVILADGWVPPHGTKWDDFAVFVPERRVADIPMILQEMEDEWQIRGDRARKAWEDFFAPSVRVHHMVEACKQLLETAHMYEDFFSRKITRHELYMRLRVGVDPVVSLLRGFRQSR